MTSVMILHAARRGGKGGREDGGSHLLLHPHVIFVPFNTDEEETSPWRYREMYLERREGGWGDRDREREREIYL